MDSIVWSLLVAKYSWNLAHVCSCFMINCSVDLIFRSQSRKTRYVPGFFSFTNCAVGQERLENCVIAYGLLVESEERTWSVNKMAAVAAYSRRELWMKLVTLIQNNTIRIFLFSNCKSEMKNSCLFHIASLVHRENSTPMKCAIRQEDNLDHR